MELLGRHIFFHRASTCWWLAETLLLYDTEFWIMLGSGMALALSGGPAEEHIWGL